MSGSINEVTLWGYLGRDPETREFTSGGKVCSFRLATSETWKDKTTGERRERTEWHSVSIFNENLATIAQSYLRKGSKAYVRGKLRTRDWTDGDGVKRYVTEIVLQGFDCGLILPDKSGGGSFPPPADREPDAPGAGAGASKAADPPTGVDIDDEIPF